MAQITTPLMELGPVDDQEAIHRLQAGHMDGLSTLYERHRLPVVRTSFFVVRRFEMAEDVAQKVFMELIHAIHRYNDARPFSPWLHKIAVRRSLDELRSEGGRPGTLDGEPEVPDQMLPPDDAAVRSERLEVFRRAIGALEPIHRAVVVLRVYHELSEHETAEALDIPIGTVKSRFKTARDLLGLILEGRAALASFLKCPFCQGAMYMIDDEMRCGCPSAAG